MLQRQHCGRCVNVVYAVRTVVADQPLGASVEDRRPVAGADEAAGHGARRIVVDHYRVVVVVVCNGRGVVERMADGERVVHMVWRARRTRRIVGVGRDAAAADENVAALVVVDDVRGAIAAAVALGHQVGRAAVRADDLGHVLREAGKEFGVERPTTVRLFYKQKTMSNKEH